MAISDKLTQLNNIKSDIKAAIIAKGGTATDDFTTYATAILNLPSGGGGVTGILFEEYQGFTNNTDFGGYNDYDSSEIFILAFNDPSGTGTSSVSEMIQLDSVVTDNLGNDITADCTFTYSGDWQYSEQMCDDGEGNETPCNQGLWNNIGVDDAQTPYAGELIASYTTSDNRTLTSSLNFSWTQTSDGQDPGE